MEKVRESFKVTHNDCRFEFSRASGAGGQNVNKRSTKARCIHPPSGAVGVCQDHREQHRNKVEAFQRMARTEEFQRWARREAARRAGTLVDIDAAVEEQMKPENITVEVQQDGKWWPERLSEEEMERYQKCSTLFRDEFLQSFPENFVNSKTSKNRRT